MGGLEEGKLVVGPWGDMSSDFHQLLRIFAETRCARMGRAAGWEGDAEGMLGKVMGEIRRAFSVVVVRSQAMCLLERLAQLGPGGLADKFPPDNCPCGQVPVWTTSPRTSSTSDNFPPDKFPLDNVHS